MQIVDYTNYETCVTFNFDTSQSPSQRLLKITEKWKQITIFCFIFCFAYFFFLYTRENYVYFKILRRKQIQVATVIIIISWLFVIIYVSL